MGKDSSFTMSYLSSPGPKEATIHASAYDARGAPCTHTLYRGPGNPDPNATHLPVEFTGYPYHGPANPRYTPMNSYQFGYPYRGMDIDRVQGTHYEGPSNRSTGLSQWQTIVHTTRDS